MMGHIDLLYERGGMLGYEIVLQASTRYGIQASCQIMAGKNLTPFFDSHEIQLLFLKKGKRPIDPKLSHLSISTPNNKGIVNLQ